MRASAVDARQYVKAGGRSAQKHICCHSSSAFYVRSLFWHPREIVIDGMHHAHFPRNAMLQLLLGAQLHGTSRLEKSQPHTKTTAPPLPNAKALMVDEFLMFVGAWGANITTICRLNLTTFDDCMDKNISGILTDYQISRLGRLHIPDCIEC